MATLDKPDNLLGGVNDFVRAASAAGDADKDIDIDISTVVSSLIATLLPIHAYSYARDREIEFEKQIMDKNIEFKKKKAKGTGFSYTSLDEFYSSAVTRLEESNAKNVGKPPKVLYIGAKYADGQLTRSTATKAPLKSGAGSDTLENLLNLVINAAYPGMNQYPVLIGEISKDTRMDPAKIQELMSRIHIAKLDFTDIHGVTKSCAASAVNKSRKDVDFNPWVILAIATRFFQRVNCAKTASYLMEVIRDDSHYQKTHVDKMPTYIHEALDVKEEKREKKAAAQKKNRRDEGFISA